MRLEHDEKQLGAYICLVCDEQFYWSQTGERAVCPHCGAKGDDPVVPMTNLDEEEYAASGSAAKIG